LPIVKDLIKKNDSDPVDKGTIKEACAGLKISPKEIKDGLKKLAD
jgi:hypothetical protein